jgi:single-stranded-DNA-specific exonuclease
MKYKLLGENNYNSLEEIQYQIIKNRGINDVDKFLNLDIEIPHWSKLKNIDKAVKCLNKHINNNSIIGILNDEDCDGITSTAMLYQYLKLYDKECNIKILIHRKKEHGINEYIINECLNNKIDLLICPDGASNDYEEHKILKENGINIIVLDHHEVKKESEYAIVVNNQLSNISTNLSGTGVVYKFLQALDEEWWMNSADSFLDLCATGMIADNMDLRDLEVQYFAQKGLNKIQNQMLKHLIDIRYDTIQEINPMAIGFYVAPYINSLIRIGTQEDKILLVEAFCDINTDRLFPHEFKRGKNKGKTINENLYEYVVRLCISYKGKQDRQIKKCMSLLERQVSEQVHSNILCLDYTHVYEDNGLSGLIANKIMSAKNKSVLVFGQKNNSYKGSARGKLENLKDIVTETNMFTLAEGHQSAFGIAFEKQDLRLFKENLKEIFKKYKIDNTHYVDFIIPYEDLDDNLIIDLCSLSKFYGTQFKEPKILIDDIDIPVSMINLNDKGSTITIKNEDKNIELILFNSSQNEYDKIIGWNESIKLNIIGKPSINNYNGKTTYQIVINEYEVLENNEINVEYEKIAW